MWYSYPADYAADGEWKGTPSIALGVLERCAHLLRRESGVTYARLLYIGAGHRRGPWGALALELNGHTYQFGGGISRFPHLIGKDRILSKSGEKLLATGIIGKISVDMLEWHWLHDQCDLNFLLSSQSLLQLENEWNALARGYVPTPIFQSWPYTDQYGISLRQDGLNCTRIQARMIGPLIGMPELDDDRPLRLFNTFLGLRSNNTFTEISSCEDMLFTLNEHHKKWMFLSQEEIAERLLSKHISGASYRQIVKSMVPLPECLLESYRRGP